jgi:hypothetical protein
MRLFQMSQKHQYNVLESTLVGDTLGDFRNVGDTSKQVDMWMTTIDLLLYQGNTRLRSTNMGVLP